MKFQTVFSNDASASDGRGIYRYTLHRDIKLEPLQGGLFPLNAGDVFTPLQTPSNRMVQFIGVNPSTAHETKNDPTVSRCMEWARRWGFGIFTMTNLFAYRATDPEVMKAFAEPVGPDNNKWLAEVAEAAELIICAWGNHGVHLDRASKVLNALSKHYGKKMRCLGFTNDGHPKHPLARGKAFVSYEFEPVPIFTL
jgi:hypothetical protein